MQESQLRQLFERIGNVKSFRFVVEKETGKPRGFGFCEYETELEAQMAIDALNGFEVASRHIKVDSADGNNDGSGGGPRGSRQAKDIDKALSKIGIKEIYNVVEGFKQLIDTDEEKAIRLLKEIPVLSLAMLKAQSVLSLMDLPKIVPMPATESSASSTAQVNLSSFI